MNHNLTTFDGIAGVLVKPSEVPARYWQDYQRAFIVNIDSPFNAIDYTAEYLTTKGGGYRDTLQREPRYEKLYPNCRWWIPAKYMNTEWGEYSL